MQRLSIIIPARNEAAQLPATLQHARDGKPWQIIVVDGQSDDATARVATDHGAQVLHAPPGRGLQMNRGAAAATGEVLLFLHADTHLPPDYAAMIDEALTRPDAVAGAFTLRIDAPHRSFRLIERLVTWRSRWLKMPYGDQGLFLPRETFEAVGGFPDVPIMEDVALMRRLRTRGRVAIINASVTTAARRWLACGVLRTTWANVTSALAYRLGFSPQRIWRYRRWMLARGIERGPDRSVTAPEAGPPPRSSPAQNPAPGTSRWPSLGVNDPE
jgi:rSAM/selenodomain-associated transferase 2